MTVGADVLFVCRPHAMCCADVLRVIFLVLNFEKKMWQNRTGTDATSAAGTDERINVVVRVRPLSLQEQQVESWPVVEVKGFRWKSFFLSIFLQVVNGSMVVLKDPRDRVPDEVDVLARSRGLLRSVEVALTVVVVCK